MAHSDMPDVTRIEYQGREVSVPPVVYEAAARFFAAYVATNKVTNENEAAMLDKVAGQALDLAAATEKMIAASNDEAKT